MITELNEGTQGSRVHGFAKPDDFFAWTEFGRRKVSKLVSILSKYPDGGSKMYPVLIVFIVIIINFVGHR